MEPKFPAGEALIWAIFLAVAFGVGAVIAKRKSISWPSHFSLAAIPGFLTVHPAAEQERTQSDVGFMPAVQIHVARHKEE